MLCGLFFELAEDVIVILVRVVNDATVDERSADERDVEELEATKLDVVDGSSSRYTVYASQAARHSKFIAEGIPLGNV